MPLQMDLPLGRGGDGVYSLLAAQGSARLTDGPDRSPGNMTSPGEPALVPPRPPAPLRLMTYSHDAFGVGHLKRNANIATRFLREWPGSSALMLVGSPCGVYFPLPPGVDYIKVPSVIKRGTGVWAPRTLNVSPEMTKAIRASIILDAAEIFRPHLLLVDYIPTGVWGELLPTLQMLKTRPAAPKVILGLRDILDAPEVTRQLWRDQSAYEAISAYYDEVFIYGCQDIFDTASTYGLDGSFAPMVTYVGYLCSEEPCRPREEMRKELRVMNDKLVVATGGGGYDAYRMMRTCAQALNLLGAHVPFEAIFVAGPLMDPAHRESLRSQADHLPLRVVNVAEDNLGVLNAADVLIGMAGYNTLLEAIRLKKRIVVVPREGPSAEQRTRAEIFSRLGLVHMISPEQISAPALAEAILDNLDAGPPSSAGLPAMDGLANTVHRMMTLVQRPAPDLAAVG